MKLHILSNTKQASLALEDYKGRKATLNTSTSCINGILRKERRSGCFYLKTREGRIDLRLSELTLLVNNEDKNTLTLISNL